MLASVDPRRTPQARPTERTQNKICGHVEAIFRYPVKSMGGERLEVAKLGWHGLDGDRRLAFRRIDDRGGFPWLSASKLPDLLLFAPHRREDGAPGDLPPHIRTPDGEEMPVFGEDSSRGSPIDRTTLSDSASEFPECMSPGGEQK